MGAVRTRSGDERQWREIYRHVCHQQTCHWWKHFSPINVFTKQLGDPWFKTVNQTDTDHACISKNFRRSLREVRVKTQEMSRWFSTSSTSVSDEAEAKQEHECVRQISGKRATLQYWEMQPSRTSSESHHATDYKHLKSSLTNTLSMSGGEW